MASLPGYKDLSSVQNRSEAYPPIFYGSLKAERRAYDQLNASALRPNSLAIAFMLSNICPIARSGYRTRSQRDRIRCPGDVRVLMPSAGGSDNPMMQHAGYRNFEKLLHCGVRLFEHPHERSPPLPINDQIDAVYRSKYRRYDARYVDAMVASEARATTIKLVPR